ncbi:uncharacterized protein VTP21DRAFT_9853 [Calcarisporiella thermophila]|uniref:uncharacterized protein n=1 Tax=Calcarisporiella thermophila TaxID=911321 RepID=UPI0037448824
MHSFLGSYRFKRDILLSRSCRLTFIVFHPLITLPHPCASLSPLEDSEPSIDAQVAALVAKLEEKKDESLRAVLKSLELPRLREFQYIDVILEDVDREKNKFLALFGNPLEVKSENATAGKNFARKLCSENFEKRTHHIKEFIETEATFVQNIQTLVDIFVRPLRNAARDRNSAIIRLYECNNIFLNIEQILSTNRAFLDALNGLEEPDFTGFGQLCAEHMVHFECYSKFLQGRDDAREYHLQEQKNNALYRSFLQRAQDRAEMRRRTLQDLIVQPVQRIGLYTLMLENILKYTPDEHEDYHPMLQALKKASEIAEMADDNHTRLAQIYFNMLNSIADCPASLVNQRRSLVGHLDATEIDITSYQAIRPVTLFLLSDRIMIVRRASTAINGLEACGIVSNGDAGYERKASISQTTPSRSRKEKRYTQASTERPLRFKGWADVRDVEIYNFDASPMSTAFYLRLTGSTPSTRTHLPREEDEAARAGDTYFGKQEFRAYIAADINEKECFLELVYRTTALFKARENDALVWYRKVGGIHLYSNVYAASKYRDNHVALGYCEKASNSLDQYLPKSPGNPYAFGMIVADKSNFRYQVFFKCKAFGNETMEDALETNATRMVKGEKPLELECSSDLERCLFDYVLRGEMLMRKNSHFYTSIHQRDTELLLGLIAQRYERARFIKSASGIIPRTTSFNRFSKLLSAVSGGTSPTRASSLPAREDPPSRPSNATSDPALSRSSSNSTTVSRISDTSSSSASSVWVSRTVSPDSIAHTDDIFAPLKLDLPTSAFDDLLSYESGCYESISPQSPVGQATTTLSNPFISPKLRSEHTPHFFGREHIDKSAQNSGENCWKLDEPEEGESTPTGGKRDSARPPSNGQSLLPPMPPPLPPKDSIITPTPPSLKRTNEDEHATVDGYDVRVLDSVALALEGIQADYEARLDALHRENNQLRGTISTMRREHRDTLVRFKLMEEKYHTMVEEVDMLYKRFNDELDGIFRTALGSKRLRLYEPEEEQKNYDYVSLAKEVDADKSGSWYRIHRGWNIALREKTQWRRKAEELEVEVRALKALLEDKKV